MHVWCSKLRKVTALVEGFVCERSKMMTRRNEMSVEKSNDDEEAVKKFFYLKNNNLCVKWQEQEFGI